MWQVWVNVLTRFWWINLKEGDHLEDLGVDGCRIYLKATGCKGLYWTNLA
jgi:hypothetical protein